MVVVLAVVESNELVSSQLLNLLGCRIEHRNDRFILSFEFPAYQEQVREYLDVVEHQLVEFAVDVLRRLIRLELHLVDKSYAICRLIRATCSEPQNIVVHVRDIVFHPASIRIIQQFVNEVDAALSIGMILLLEILLD